MTEPQILLKNEKTQNDLNHIRTPQRYLRTTLDCNQRYLRTTFVQPSYISNPIHYLKVNLIQLRAMFAWPPRCFPRLFCPREKPGLWMITLVSCTWNRGSRNFCAAVGWFVGLFPSSAGCLGLSGRWNRWKRQREKRKIGKRKVVMGIRSIDHEIKKDFLIDVWYLRYFEIGLRLNQMTYGRSPSSFTKWTQGWLHLGIKLDEYQSYEVSHLKPVIG